MDDHRTTRPITIGHEKPSHMRVLLLGLAGILIAGAVSYGFNEFSKKRQEPVLGAIPPEGAVLPASKTAAVSHGGAVLPAGAPVHNNNSISTSSSAPRAQDASLRKAPPLVKTLAADSVAAPATLSSVANHGGAVLPVPGAALQKGATASQAYPGQQTAQMPVPDALPGGLIPPTSRLSAAAQARALTGRVDPCAELTGLEPFPRVTGQKLASQPDVLGPPAGAEKLEPPPPPPDAGPDLAPPPPPDAGLSVAELPPPPARPSVADKMKLVAILGDRAILSCGNQQIRAENKWPATVTLGPGEQFESVSVVNVGSDSVTLEEDGEQSVKTLGAIR